MIGALLGQLLYYLTMLAIRALSVVFFLFFVENVMQLPYVDTHYKYTLNYL